VATASWRSTCATTPRRYDVHESSTPWRGIEIRTIAQFLDADPSEADQRMAARYLNPQEAAAFAAANRSLK
jgi:hypothetical protein